MFALPGKMSAKKDWKDLLYGLGELENQFSARMPGPDQLRLRPDSIRTPRRSAHPPPGRLGTADEEYSRNIRRKANSRIRMGNIFQPSAVAGLQARSTVCAPAILTVSIQNRMYGDSLGGQHGA
jgi:hypothetical protein